MINQEELFHRWYHKFFGVEAYRRGCDMKQCGDMYLGWRSAIGYKSAIIKNLQLENKKLRGALDQIVINDGQFKYLALEALGEKNNFIHKHG